MNTLFHHEKALSGTKSLLISELQIDPRTQRELKPAWANEIGRNFDPDKLGVLHVSERQDSSYWMVDGQHRLEGVKIWLGDKVNGQRIECKVYKGLSIAEEAALFVALNNYLRPTRIEQYLKAVTAKDPLASKIDAIVKSAGFRVDRFSGDKTITAVGALQTIYTGFVQGRRMKSGEQLAVHPDLLRQVLAVVTGAWDGSSEACNGYILAGIGRVLAAHGREIDRDALTRKLAAHTHGPSGLLTKARGRRETLGGTLERAVADHVIETYNKGLRAGKIQAL